MPGTDMFNDPDYPKQADDEKKAIEKIKKELAEKQEQALKILAQSDKCQHDFVYLRSSKSRKDCGYQDLFTRIDYFYCRKCLEYREKKREEGSRGEPDFYKD